jgi:hypothetical protein
MAGAGVGTGGKMASPQYATGLYKSGGLMSYTIDDQVNQKIEAKKKELTRKEIKKQLSRNGYGRHTYFEMDIAVSKAWMSLNGSCKSILVLCLQKRRMRFLKKGDKSPTLLEETFTMTYKELEAEPFNFHREQIRRAFKILLKRGFLEIAHQGGAHQKDKTIYKYSEKYQFWQQGSDFQLKKKDVHRGFQGQGLGAVSTHKNVGHQRTQNCGTKFKN